MPDPVARKRLKKKMLDRWENEGGRIAADSAADDTRPSEGKGQEKKLSSQRRNSPLGSPAASTKKRKHSPK